MFDISGRIPHRRPKGPAGSRTVTLASGVPGRLPPANSPLCAVPPPGDPAPVPARQPLSLPFAFAAWRPAACSSALRTALVVALLFLVHHSTVAAEPKGKTGAGTGAAAADAIEKPARPKRVDLVDLPGPVLEMRDAILAAVRHGEIDELRTAIEWNELPPEFGLPDGVDPIEHWRATSTDGNGRDLLALLGNLLAAAPARLPIGPDLENNDVYVWPYLSELSPKSLTPSEEVDLFRLVPADEAVAMRGRDKWTWYRLAIAADGTWHIFSKTQ